MMIKILIILAVISLINGKPHQEIINTNECQLSGPKEKLCKSSKTEFYPFFSSKTTYASTYEVNKLKNIVINQLPDNYEPAMFYYFSRHGIKYPELKEIEAMNQFAANISKKFNENESNISNHVCNETINEIKSFKSHWNNDNDNHITQSGLDELELIGKRFKLLLPNILDPKSEGFSLNVGVNCRDRTVESASGFLKGLYGNDYNESLHLKTEVQSNVTMCHRLCGKTEKPKPEMVKKLENSTIFRDLLTNVESRLGFASNTLTFSNIKNIRDLCAYNYANNGDTTWCPLLTKEEYKFIEYYSDLTDFYKNYNDIAKKKSPCVIVSELINNIDQVISTGIKRSFLRFTHSPAIRAFYSFLNLFNNFGSNNEVDHSDYCINSKYQREWRQSIITPFSSNVAFVLLKPKAGNEFKILTLVNEIPMRVKNCKTEFCSLDDFKSSFEESISKCNLENICEEAENEE